MLLRKLLLFCSAILVLVIATPFAIWRLDNTPAIPFILLVVLAILFFAVPSKGKG